MEEAVKRQESLVLMVWGNKLSGAVGARNALGRTFQKDLTQLDCMILKKSRLRGKTLAWPPSPCQGREAHIWFLGRRRHSKLPVSQGVCEPSVTSDKHNLLTRERLS